MYGNGLEYHGVLDPYFETGCEGVVWALIEGGKEGYEALNIIHEGDYLTIYGEDGQILFDGFIVCDREAGWREYPLNPGHGQPEALGNWIHWTQAGWRSEDWAKLFFHPYLPGNEGKTALRAKLIKRKQ